MQIVIDITEEDYLMMKLVREHGMGSFAMDFILNGTVLPDNATNGDVIKAMFPNMQFNIVNELVWTNIDGQSTRFLVEWWNAPYQKGGK